MKSIAPFLTAAVLVVGLTPASGDLAKDETKCAPMPWHLVDTWWDLGKETPFESPAVDVTIVTVGGPLEGRGKRRATLIEAKR